MFSETEIRSFRVDMPDEAIADLRQRIAATRWPTKELVADRSQGVQLATLQELARFWTIEYDWRAYEATLNVTYFHEVDKGGHFAAWEEPELFTAEIRAAFKPLR